MDRGVAIHSASCSVIAIVATVTEVDLATDMYSVEGQVATVFIVKWLDGGQLSSSHVESMIARP
jgi:hypothetical protein